MGVKGAASGESLRIQYDILAGEFQPYSNAAYTDEEKDFIWDHIQQFQLNDSEDSREQLLYYIKMIIDTGGKLPEYEYNNYIVKLFAEKIEEYSIEKRVRICKVLNVALNVAV